MNDKQQVSFLTPDMMERIRVSAREVRKGLEAETDQDLEIALATEKEILAAVRAVVEKELPCDLYSRGHSKICQQINPDEKTWCPNCLARRKILECRSKSW